MQQPRSNSTSSPSSIPGVSSPQPPIRLILIDIFNTLLRPNPPPAHQYAKIARHGRFSLPGHLLKDEPVSLAFKAAMKKQLALHPNYGRDTLPPLPDGEAAADRWWRLVIKETIVDALSVYSEGKCSKKRAKELWAPAERRGICEEILLRFGKGGQAYELLEDVEPFLRGLAERNAKAKGGREVRIVLASNSDERILDACAALGLGEGGQDVEDRGRDRDGALLSYDLGHCKPSASFFSEALRLAGGGEGNEAAIKGEEVLYVGDDLHEDAVAARDSGTGITGVWLDREEKGRGDGKMEGVKRVVSLSEVLDLVDERQRSS
ncbi:hypothetical protein BDZ90DRAFT_224375 [Jaminaea rosea]|uniref:HAD-like protein n=1 Tax=Jaminaea rosea TaxID=1569628 RepID=A0A316UNJ7_9BASI|nr:hypothetical protein BDZ90DRAFT_224375 [Jaminaea rosea]PWN24735.1 hypothetical protein BDZ90DRAFT_224375 [Jaminaea rosea]